MNKLPRSFYHRKQSERMDQSTETPSPTLGPKLVRKNAAKNFKFNPSPSAPLSSAVKMSSAPRARSLDLNHSSEKSLRIENGQLDKVWESLGLSGPEDFEIPKAVWEDYWRSSDVIQRRNPSLWDDNVVGNHVGGELGLVFPEVIGQIRGDRPPFLTPPQVILLNDEVGDLYPRRSSPAEDDTSSFTSHDGLSSSSTDSSPNVQGKLHITSWQKGNCLGQGSFGTVYEGISSDGMFFAIKEVSLLEQGRRGKESVSSLQTEIDLLSQLQHENIVQYLGTATYSSSGSALELLCWLAVFFNFFLLFTLQDDAHLYIFLELLTKGSIASLYRIYVLKDSVVAAYTRQILSGLKYLHSYKIVHRDIKCANILVASTGIVKLADFGLAKVMQLNDLKSCKGTALWMAPEVVNQRNQGGYGTAADIWSLGCTVLEMATGQLPYHPLESVQAIYMIGHGEPPPVSESLSTDLKDFIVKCLQVNPNDRPTASELLGHPFLKRHAVSSFLESPDTGRWPAR